MNTTPVILEGLGISTTAGADSWPLVADAVLVGIDWAVRLDGSVDNGDIEAEIALIRGGIATPSYAAANRNSILSRIALHQNQAATGQTQCHANKFVGPIDIRLTAGQVIYLNVGTSGSTAFVHAVLYLVSLL